MTIAIDISRAINEKAGVGRYVAGIVNALLAIDNKNRYLLIYSFVRGRKEKMAKVRQYQRTNVQFQEMALPGRVKETLLASKFALSKPFFSGADVYLAPTFLDSVESLKIPQALVVHDLTNLLFPIQAGRISFRYGRRLRQAAHKADKIIAVSDSTKKDLIEHLKIKPEKIAVIYPGLNDFPKPASELPAGLKPKSYILNVGTIEPRKNLGGLIKAYELLEEELQKQFPLVIVGAKGWNEEVADAKNQNPNIYFLGYRTDGELAKLYSEAKLFIYPSLYEGFGLPVLEAMSFGTPVVTSNTSSLPEVAGEAGILVDPTRIEAITEAMQSVLLNPTLGREMSEKGQIQVAKFNWQTSARAVLRTLENLVESKRHH